MIEANAFYLEKPTLLYLINDAKEIVDIVDFPNMEDYENFKLKHQNFKFDVTLGDEGTNRFKTRKIPIYSEEINKYSEEKKNGTFSEIPSSSNSYLSNNSFIP